MSGLEEDPFDWRVTKDGRVFVSRGGRQVTIVGGDQARKLSAALDAALARDDVAAAQQLLARVTGNYKHGNERAPRRGRPRR